MRLPATLLRIRGRYSSRASLPYPESKGVRAVQISSVAPFAGIERLPVPRWSELEQFRPQLVIGTCADLRLLEEKADFGTLNLGSLDHAIFVLTACGDPPLSDAARTEFWRRFHVPSYELFVGPGSTLLAYECAAAEGWHLQPGVGFALTTGELVLTAAGKKSLRTGLTGYLGSEPCECGQPAPRIKDIACWPGEVVTADVKMVAAISRQPVI